MPENKPNPAHAGMVPCVLQRALGPHKAGARILMHPMDALEHHNLGIVQADKKFVDELKALDAAKRKAREEADAQADAPQRKPEE